MKIDIKQLELYLKDKNYDQVRKIITEAINEPLSDEDKGSVLTSFASAYLQIMNSINSAYRDSLKEAVESMRIINQTETDMVDKLKLEEVKKDLGI